MTIKLCTQPEAKRTNLFKRFQSELLSERYHVVEDEMLHLGVIA